MAQSLAARGRAAAQTAFSQAWAFAWTVGGRTAKAQALMAQADYEAASHLLLRLVRKQPTQINLLLSLAFCQKRLLRKAAHLQVLQEAHRLDDRRPDVLYALAEALIDQRRSEEALPYLGLLKDESGFAATVDRVLGSLAIAAAGKSLTWSNFWQGLVSATRVSCMIMFILAGAAFLTKTMAFTGIPRELAEFVHSLNLSPYGLIAVLVVVYLILGTALDGISMIVLTSAVVLPMVQKAGFDLVWFGIFIIMLVEIAEITPPVGFNLFVLQNMTGIDSNRIARVTMPFFGCMILGIVLITVFPSIVTSVPNWLMGVSR